ncbi:MAG TPA: hypothetical protein VIU87_25540 [Mycobacterium sp.]
MVSWVYIVAGSSWPMNSLRTPSMPKESDKLALVVGQARDGGGLGSVDDDLASVAEDLEPVGA